MCVVVDVEVVVGVVVVVVDWLLLMLKWRLFPSLLSLLMLAMLVF